MHKGKPKGKQKKKDDKKFREDGWSQLYFIYKNSDNYERTYNRYPISRRMDEFKQDEIELAPKMFK